MPELHRRKRGTGTVYERDGFWIGLAPQYGGRGKAKQLRIAKHRRRAVVESELDAWLNASGRIVHRDLKPEKRCRRKAT